jgi:uncharacterized membrane protein YbhN (UPF0104 family)
VPVSPVIAVRGKPILKVVIKGTVSIVLLAVVFMFVPIREVVQELRHVDPGYAIAGLLLSPPMACLRAIQIRIFAVWQSLSLTIGQIIRIGYISQFYGLFLPGILAGGAVRWYKFTRHDGKPVEALAIIASGRLVSMLIGVVTGLVCWLADPVARHYTGFGVGLVGIFLTLMSLALLWWHYEAVWRGVARLARGRRIPARLRDLARRALDVAPDLRELGARRIAWVVAVSALENLLGIFALWLFAAAIGIELAMVSAAWIRTYIMVILLLPISVAGFGVREGGLIVMLAAYGVSAKLAVAYSFLLVAVRLTSALAGGVFELWGFVWPAKPATGGRA